MEDTNVTKKRGRKKGSGVKDKMFTLFNEGVVTYNGITDKNVVVKEYTFNQYLYQWKKQSK